jgi:hypothetical protein
MTKLVERLRQKELSGSKVVSGERVTNRRNFDGDEAADVIECLTLRCSGYARALNRMRQMLIPVHDELEDEGDRVYLGSSNHAELIHDAWHLAESLNWDEIMRDTQPDTPLAAVNRELQAEIQRLRKVLENPPKHKFWGAGDPDCPREIKAGNGELHTLRCKVCGLDNPRDEICREQVPA